MPPGSQTPIDDWQELLFLSALPWTGLPLEVWDRKRIALIDVRFPAELVIRYQADAIVLMANAIHTGVNRSLCTDISHGSACEPKVSVLIIPQIFSLRSNDDYVSEYQSSRSWTRFKPDVITLSRVFTRRWKRDTGLCN